MALVVLLLATLGGVAAAGPPAGAGAGKALLYDSNTFTCATGATAFSDGPYGFVVLNTNANGDLIIQVSLKGATPNATYDIWVNQDPGACPLPAPTAPDVLMTNRKGNGNVHLKIDRIDDATMFWISAVGGDQAVLRGGLDFRGVLGVRGFLG